MGGKRGGKAIMGKFFRFSSIVGKRREEKKGERGKPRQLVFHISFSHVSSERKKGKRGEKGVVGGKGGGGRGKKNRHGSLKYTLKKPSEGGKIKEGRPWGNQLLSLLIISNSRNQGGKRNKKKRKKGKGPAPEKKEKKKKKMLEKIFNFPL